METSLSYPLSIEDVVDNWEDVLELWDSLNDEDIRRINLNRYDRDGFLREYERRAMDHYLRRWWHSENRLEVLNAMIEGEDLSEFDLTWPINEADIEEAIQAIDNVFWELLTSEGYCQKF